MTKYYFILFIFFFLTTSCKKNLNEKAFSVSKLDTVKIVRLSKLDYAKYMKNLPKSDTLCNNEIERAKRDLAKYDGIYVQTICFGCDFKPYEDEIKEVLKKRKFKLGIQDIGCVIYEGQTRGCYFEYIDLEMKKKYGKNYKSQIETNAQNILIRNIKLNKIISIYDLEQAEKPKLLNYNVAIESDYYTTIKTELPINKTGIHNLFTDIDFIIEKDGTISNLKQTNWVNENGVDKKYKKNLTDLAFKTLTKDYNNWRPGSYKGNKARIQNSLRISFE